MIQPINSTLNSNNLEPVKVPHFTGRTRIIGNSAKTQNTDTVSFKQNAKGVIESAKKGAAKALKAIGSGAKKAWNFLKEFFKSIFSDAKDIAKKKGAKKIVSVDNVADLLQ